MVKIIWINIILFCLSTQRTFGQNDTLQTYMVSYADKVITSLTFQNDNNSFIITEEVNGKKHNFEFFPNIKQKLSVGVTYKLISVSVGFTPWFMKSSSSNYKSSNFNFSTQFNHKKWYQTVSIVKQKGFFTQILNDKSIYLPSFRSIKIGGTTSYVYNDKFSFSALFNQNQWQIKSAGSFVPNFSFFYTNLMNKDDKTSFNLEMYSLSLTPAYYYTWVINGKLFLSGGLGVGAGIDFNRKKTSALGELIFNSKLGYNTSSFYSYLEINSTNFFFNEKNTHVNNAFVNSLLTVGFRFDPPQKIKKVYDDELKRLPF